tara:strand:- start:490 stop:813 length:324 start_codon:yes stop_codon:yes gene_type:complete
MNHKEFFNVLIGNPPPQIELEIEIRKREVREMPNAVMKEICCELIKETKLQDMLIMAAMERITETETKLLRLEMAQHHYTKNIKPKKKYKTKKTLFDRFKAMLSVFR